MVTCCVHIISEFLHHKIIIKLYNYMYALYIDTRTCGCYGNVLCTSMATVCAQWYASLIIKLVIIFNSWPHLELVR